MDARFRVSASNLSILRCPALVALVFFWNWPFGGGSKYKVRALADGMSQTCKFGESSHRPHTHVKPAETDAAPFSPSVILGESLPLREARLVKSNCF